MIFTAYFDEADTHGPEPTIIMGAYLGHAYQWRRFESKLDKLRTEYGFQTFHTKHFKSRAGEFKHWKYGKMLNLIGDLADIAEYTLTDGIVIHLEHERYVSEYRAPPIPKKMALDSQYGVCFRVLMERIVEILGERGFRDTLHVVVEDGHANVWDCGRIFNEMKQSWRRRGESFMGTFTVSDKASCLPLMAADFLASGYSMSRALAASAGRSPVYEDAGPPPPGDASYEILGIAPGGLKLLKEKFEEARREATARWRARRDAGSAPSPKTAAGI